ncbi:contactin-4 isoform X1 [Paramuricea clavata]|uniref:Contactin-4 isoform X1 n=1 Tax=Paramuricea clavata TaxID=317549 RepID=A0A6S7KLK9_PARCT|nr:contactin-4 isoform X1 [Paramuricea clavata]
MLIINRDNFCPNEQTLSSECITPGTEKIMFYAFRPTPEYSWKRIDVYDKEHAVENGVDGITFDDRDPRLLVIKSASKDHAGQYFCTATIGDKNDTVEGSLTFEVQPTWIGKSIEAVSPSVYSNHSWTCNATGFPTPTYEWYKNGVKLAGR